MGSEPNFIGPVNLGNPDEFTMLQLADAVRDATSSSSKVIFKNLPVDDPQQRQPNITLAQHALGWKPEIKLSQGLNRTVDYFMRQGVARNTPVSA